MLTRHFLFPVIITSLTNSLIDGQSAKEQLALANSARLTSEKFYDEIPFKDQLGYIIVPLKMGENTYDYIFDTGGFNTATSEVIKNAGLSALMEVETGSSNKLKSKTKLLKIPALQIGKATFQYVGVFNFDFLASPIINCNTNGGLIGKSIIRDAVWQIDHRKSIIRVLDMLENMPFTGEGKRIKIKLGKTFNPFLVIYINGKQVECMLDLGYGGLLSLTEKTAASLNIKNSIATEGEGDVGANGILNEKIFVEKLDNLTIGKTELKNKIAFYSNYNNHNLLRS